MSPVAPVSTGSGNDAPLARSEDFAQAWRDLRADDDIQFAPIPDKELEPEEPPQWLVDFGEWLERALSPVGDLMVAMGPVLFWLLVAVVAALLAFAIWRIIGPRIAGRNRAERKRETPEWAPNEAAAMALLEDADRLASEGKYDEATHLLLLRSVGQIAEARPDLVEPSSTARELAAEPALPEGARTAFGVIASRVERSLFALRQLSQDDWQAAREAYADFALARKALTA